MSDNKKPKMWVVYGEEQLPLCLVVAKTEGGAKAVYEKRTGKTRHGIHVEEIVMEKQFYPFTPLI
jgi:hypothetical protein